MIFRGQQKFSSEFDEFPFAGGASGVKDFGDVPVVTRCGGDEVSVHGPVVVLAEGEAVGGVVVVATRISRLIGVLPSPSKTCQNPSPAR